MTLCEVLRIGHRPERDKRITTHVALTARAFGASRIYLANPDSRVIKSVEEVVGKFGGDFSIEPTSNPKKVVSSSNLLIVHLTMFGLPIDTIVEDIITEGRDILFKSELRKFLLGSLRCLITMLQLVTNLIRK